MYQRWEELLFLHWSFDPSAVQETLPPGLRVDTFEGKAWIGVVPFFMSGVRPRFLPAVPGISSFQELNLRTYVMDEQGRRGVWFYSLDTSHRLPVWVARSFFHLNYLHASMRASRRDDVIEYYSQRSGTAGSQRFAWKRTGEVRLAQEATLEHFLVERYRLFAYDSKRKQLLTGCVSHDPYQIQDVALSEYSTRLFELDGLSAPQGAPESVIASAGADVRIHPLERV